MPKNSNIIIARGIRVDKDYINVTDINMLSVVQANAAASANNFSFIRRNRSLKANFAYGTAITCNYMAFQNPDYSNKWFFAWIDNVEYVGENTIEIEFTIDQFSTWFSSLNKSSVFVEREHVSDDGFGKHNLPEPVKADKLITNHVGYKRYTNFSIVVFWEPSQISSSDLGYALNGVYYTTAMVNRYNCNNAGISALQSDLSVGGSLANASIISINVVPNDFFSGNIISGDIKNVGQMDTTTFTYTAPAQTNLDGYIPVNKKCLIYPYNMLAVSNGNLEKIYRYEKFAHSLQGAGSFKIVGGVIPNGGATCYPMAYDGLVYENVPESMDMGDLPMIASNIDSFAAWLAQKSSGSVMQGIMSTLTGALAGGLKGGAVGAAVGAGAGLIGGVTNYMSQQEAATAEKDHVVGTNNVTIDMVQGLMGFSFAQRCAVADDAERIDRFFSQFGYNVSTVKVPNYTGRTYWNYVKINGSCGYGNIPEAARAEINRILNNGTTIWHSHNNIGNYFIGGSKMQNPIV